MMRVIAKRNTFLITVLLVILSATSNAINPNDAQRDTMLPKHLRQRFTEEADETNNVMPLINSGKINRSENQEVHASTRKNLEYSILNATALIDFWNDTSIINSTDSNNATVSPFADPQVNLVNHNDAQSWLIYIFKVLLFFILFILYFASIKKCCILPALRRLGWITEPEPEPIDTSQNRYKSVDAGPLSKKAGLSGMLMKERKLVVNEVFKNSHFCYDSSIPLSEQKAQIIEQNSVNEDNVNTSNENVVENMNELSLSPSSTNMSSTSQTSYDEATSLSHCMLCKGNDANEDPASDRSDSVGTNIVDTNISSDATSNVPIFDKYNSNNAVKDKEDSSQDHSAEDDDSVDDSIDNDENQCSICLSAFKDKNMVMRTGKCEHVFHVECSMGWFRKKDYCPYCRCEIMTPSEMLQAAIIVLGKERVEELRRCYKMGITPQEPQQQEPQHDELEIQNEAETNSNSPAIVPSS